MEGRKDTEQNNSDRETNKSSPCGWRGERKINRNVKGSLRFKGCVTGSWKAYVIVAGLCVSMLSTLAAIVCDLDKLLTLGLRKCSVSKTKR